MVRIINFLRNSVVGLFARLSVEFDVVGLHHLQSGPAIFAANHPTSWDPLLLLTIAPKGTAFLTAVKAFEIPLFGGYLRRAGHLPIGRGIGRAALEEARNSLRSGRTIGIFPEGSLSPAQGGLFPLHSGAARLALASGAPVIPIGIAPPHEHLLNFPLIFKKEKIVGRIFFRGHYAVTIGDPLSFQGDAEDRDAVRSASDHIKKNILKLSQLSNDRRMDQETP